jgi:hypothetical protein
MARRTRYVPGMDIPAKEVLRDSKGRTVTDEYVDAAAADAVRKVRRRGRPSLSESGESPLLRVRISPELDEAVSRAAEASGETRANWIRHTLSEASRRAG